MGVVNLKADEQVMFPAPYEEGAVYPVIVTTQRVLSMPDKGPQREVATSEISFVGRLTKRPLLFPGLALLLIGLPLLIWGLIELYNTKDLSSEDGDAIVAESDTVESTTHKRIVAGGLGVLGLLFGAGGVFMASRQKFSVQVRAGKKQLKLPVEDKMAQTQLLMTTQAAVNGAKAQAKAASQSAPAPMAQVQPVPAKK
jgi:hypothetical protein